VATVITRPGRQNERSHAARYP